MEAELPKLYTVAQFDRVPDPPGGRYDLHDGELVFACWPMRDRGDLQYRLRKRGVPFSEARHRSIGDWLVGSPEFVIEVKSPWNSEGEFNGRDDLAEVYVSRRAGLQPGWPG